jgi:hypothetical protein
MSAGDAKPDTLDYIIYQARMQNMSDTLSEKRYVRVFNQTKAGQLKLSDRIGSGGQLLALAIRPGWPAGSGRPYLRRSFQNKSDVEELYR